MRVKIEWKVVPAINDNIIGSRDTAYMNNVTTTTNSYMYASTFLQ